MPNCAPTNDGEFGIVILVVVPTTPGLITSGPSTDSPTGKIIETERLGGLLRSYHRAA